MEYEVKKEKQWEHVYCIVIEMAKKNSIGMLLSDIRVLERNF